MEESLRCDECVNPDRQLPDQTGLYDVCDEVETHWVEQLLVGLAMC